MKGAEVERGAEDIQSSKKGLAARKAEPQGIDGSIVEGRKVSRVNNGTALLKTRTTAHPTQRCSCWDKGAQGLSERKDIEIDVFQLEC